MIRAPLNQRGISLSINMLIITAIGLVVLVISIMMYVRFTGNSSKTLNDCETLGGVCVDPVNGGCDTVNGYRKALGVCANSQTGQGSAATSEKVCCFPPQTN